MRSKEFYICGQPRRPNGVAVDSGARVGKSKKDYYRQMVAFHGSETAVEKWFAEGKRGYGNK